MKTKLNKYIAELQRWEYKPLLGNSPRFLVDLVDGDCQICLGDNADYIKIEEAVELLNSLSFAITAIQSEVDKIVNKAKEMET